jgi:hypothetical protein
MTTKRPSNGQPLNLVGAIGKRPCEISLQNILHELDDRKLVNRVMSLILAYREGLRQISYIPKINWRKSFTYDWRQRFYKKVFENDNLPLRVQTHMWCCMTAYYRDHMMIIYNQECKHEPESERASEG